MTQIEKNRHQFVQPFYYEKLDKDDLKEIQEYISKLTDGDYTHNEFDHYDGHEDQHYKKYRSCEIHYPKTSLFTKNILYRIGKKIIRSVNKKYYQYDLSDVFEFQLIKYYEGGNYNWHCDYGVSPRPHVVRKLSMTMQLTDPSEYEGGELQLVDYQNHTNIAPNNLGTTIVFDAKVPHKVWPVTWGKRIALVGWASGPPLK